MNDHAPIPARSEAAAAVDAAITSRRSVRRFLATPVSRAEVAEILAVASRAPSGTNMQPWKVNVVAGAAQRALSAAIGDAFTDHADDHDQEFAYYPAEFPEPYKSRRRKVGWDLYGVLGIARGETDKMRAQMARNYLFFDAPVGLIFSIDRVLEIGSWLDCGMFLENIMIAARARGLDTCPQVAFAKYHKVIRAQLDIPDDQIVICGMSLGHADPAAPENTLVTEREPPEVFARFHGFE
ncbi:MAG: nitroreductase [Alphaproteobacteria bacterium]|jgi:nitroreductase|nr:nitroreductase [Alphaproteobacteria bacterium]